MSIAASVVSGVTSLFTGIGAAKTLERSAKSAQQFERERFNLLYQQALPFIEAGQNAIAVIQNLLGIGAEQYQSLEESPGAAFARDQSEKALARRQSARGDRLGGRAAAEATRQGVGFGVANVLAPLFQLAGVAQAPLAGITGSGTDLAKSNSILELARGQARAGNYDAVNNAVQSALGNYQGQQMQNSLLSFLQAK